MKIDYLIVEPGSGLGPPEQNRATALAIGLKQRGFSTAILTLRGDPRLSSTPVIKLNYLDRIAQGERWPDDVAHRHNVYDYRNLASCELGYIQLELSPRSFDQLVAEVPAAFHEIDKFFTDNDIRHVVHTCVGGEIVRLAVKSIARKRGIPMIFNTGTYFPDRVLFCLDGFGELYDHPKVRFRDLNTSQQRFLLDYLAAERAQTQPRPDGTNAQTFASCASRFVTMRKFLEPGRLKNAARKSLQFANYAMSTCFFSRPRQGANYVYFPLQSSVESTIILGMPFRFDQVETATQLANALPSGTHLYARPHPVVPALTMSLKQAIKTSALPHTHIISPQVNGPSLVRHAKTVVTVSGSTGYEALLLKRPVVVMGYPPYRGWGITQDVISLDELPNAIAKAMSFVLTEDMLLDFLSSFESAHVRGNWWLPPFNPDDMAAGVLDMFDRMRGSDT